MRLRRERGGQEHAHEDSRRRLVADEGTVELNGKTAAFAGPRDAEDAGVRITHQELNLVPDLTVSRRTSSLVARRRGLGWLDDRTMEAEVRPTL